MINKIDKSLYKKCNLCPRKCNVNRLSGEKGFCKTGHEPLLSCGLLHYGEEPPVTGRGGSGTLFFAGCTLRCKFCQNYQLSREIVGKVTEKDLLSDIMIALQEKGAENINFVTATHFLPSVAEAVSIAKNKGLKIPLVWNSSGYETDETVEMLLEFIDIFLPDLKTMDPDLSGRLFNAKDYPQFATSAILKMTDRKKTDFSLIEKEGVMKEGVIVRHLVLPGEIKNTKEVLKWFSENVKDRAILSLMFQYEPHEPLDSDSELPRRRIIEKEVDEVYELLDEYGIDDGFIQEFEEGSLWTPDFTKSMPFPGGKEKPVWHYLEKN
ncbi:MAG: radical SAM protein [Spirochaetaceae bacterium]|nr:radical SAM protein [Spirochaetaceae bacterium]